MMNFNVICFFLAVCGAGAISRSPRSYVSYAPASKSFLSPASSHRLSVRGGMQGIFYKNSEGAVFGPFPRDQILQWVDRGLFPPGVPMSGTRDGPFVAREAFLSGGNQGLGVAEEQRISADSVPCPSSDSNSPRALPARSVSSIMTHESAWTGSSASASGLGSLVHRSPLSRPVRKLQRLLRETRSALTLPVALHSQLVNVAPGVLRSASHYLIIFAVSQLINLALLLRGLSILVGVFARVVIEGHSLVMTAAPHNTCKAIWSYDMPRRSLLDTVKLVAKDALRAFRSLSVAKSRDKASDIARHLVPIDSLSNLLIVSVLFILNSEIIAPAAVLGVMNCIQSIFRAVAVGSSSVLRMKYNMNLESAASFKILASAATTTTILSASLMLGYWLTPAPYFAVAVCILWEAVAQLRQHSRRPPADSPRSLFHKMKVQRLETALFSDTTRDQLERFPDLKIAVEAERGRSAADWFVSSLPSQRSVSHFVQSEVPKANGMRRALQLLFILSVARAFGGHLNAPGVNKIKDFVASGLHLGLSDATRCVSIDTRTSDALISESTGAFLQYALPSLLWLIESRTLSSCIHSLSDLEDLFSERQPLRPLLSQQHLGPASSRPGLHAPQEGKWTSDGPDKLGGIYFDQVMAIGGGRVRLRDLTMHLPAGQVSALVGVGTGGMDEVEAVIQLLWSGDGSADPEALLPRLQRGGVFVQGRGLRDWDAAAMQRRMVVMKPGDVQLPITIGVLCGIDPAITRGGNPLQSLPEKYRRAVELSGVAEVIRLLPNGINTDLNEVPLLSPGQRYRTSLCRALTALDRDVVLLHLGTEFMGEYEEEKFLATLRAMVRPEQVVIVTSAKLAIANHVDHAVAFERGVAPRTIKARPPPQS